MNMIDEDKLVQGFVDEAIRCLNEASVIPTGEPAYNDSIKMASNIYEMLKKTEMEEIKLNDEISQAARKHDIDLQKMELERKKRDDSVVTEDRRLDFEREKLNATTTDNTNKLDLEERMHTDNVQIERSKIKSTEKIEERNAEINRKKMYTDSLIFVGKAGLIFLLGTAMFKSEEDCKLYSKNIVQTIGKIIG